MRKKDALDKLFVNCNKIQEGKAKRILSSKDSKDLSIKNFDWEIPNDLSILSKKNKWFFNTFIGLGRWKGVTEKNSTKFICIAQRGELIYLEPEIVKIMYNSIKDELK